MVAVKKERKNGIKERDRQKENLDLRKRERSFIPPKQHLETGR